MLKKESRFWRALINSCLLALFLWLKYLAWNSWPASFLEILALVFITAVFLLVPFFCAAYFFPAQIAQVVTLILIAILASLPIDRQFRHPHAPIEVTENSVTKAGNEKPNILILVLDEQIGVEGIPLISEKARKLKEDLITDYTHWGFDVYGRAFSNYFGTTDSVPSILNAKLFPFREPYGLSLPENVLLKNLHQKGYRLAIYESDYFDYCQGLSGFYDRCVKYQQASTKFISRINASFLERIVFLINGFMTSHQSRFMTQARKKLYDFMKRPLILYWGNIPSLEILERLKKDMLAEPRGTVFFAHLLLPHYPFALDDQCRVKPLSEWKVALYDYRLQTWEKSYDAYFDQAACTHKRVRELFTALKEKGVFDDMMIVVVGDHGSRILPRLGCLENAGQLKTRDYLDMFSAFAAVKIKGADETGQAAGGSYILDKTPLIKIMAGAFGLSLNSEAGNPDKIYLHSRKGRIFKPYDMPDF